MLIINDLHLGVQRTGGTTPQSQLALRQYLRDRIATLLDDEGAAVTVNGDLFDGFTVDTVEVVRTYEVFADWLHGNQARRLNLIAGNHDWNPRGDKISSFHLLCVFLTAHFPERAFVFDKGLARVSKDVWCIPHQANQSIFDLQIEKAVAMEGKDRYLLLHCNVKNTFAEHSDHSLNLGDEQLGNLMRAGWTLVVGHEHQGYTLRAGRVIVVGNQVPSSVADCLGEKRKRAVRITDDGLVDVETWNAEGSFCEIDWRSLNEPVVLHNFFRVTGEATAAEAAEVINAISRFRQRSVPEVFVITNNTKIEGVEVGVEIAGSIEHLRSFDVLSTIMEHLDEKEQQVVKGLIA